MFRYIYIYSRLENSAYGECVKEFPTLRVEPMKGMERGIQKVWFSSYSYPNPCAYNTFIELRFKLRRGDQRSRFLPSYQSLYSGSYPRYTGWNKSERWRICWKMQSKEFQGQFILITVLNLTYSIENYVSHFTTDLFQSGNFPRVFSQGETFQVWPYCSAWPIQPVIVAALGPLALPRCNAQPHCSLQRLSRSKLTFWEVAAWEIAYLESCHSGNCLLESRP